MKRNIGIGDQAARIGIGFVLMFLAGTGVIGPWGWLGIVPMATGAIRYCPLYRLFHFSTARQRS